MSLTNEEPEVASQRHAIVKPLTALTHLVVPPTPIRQDPPDHCESLRVDEALHSRGEGGHGVERVMLPSRSVLDGLQGCIDVKRKVLVQ
jgi:hypothetical protein